MPCDRGLHDTKYWLFRPSYTNVELYMSTSLFNTPIGSKGPIGAHYRCPSMHYCHLLMYAVKQNHPSLTSCRRTAAVDFIPKPHISQSLYTQYEIQGFGMKPTRHFILEYTLRQREKYKKENKPISRVDLIKSCQQKFNKVCSKAYNTV